MDIHMDQDTKLGRYILCVSTEPAVTPHEFTSLERHELRLLLLVLSYVFMKCDAVFEHVLFGYLSKLGLDNEPHEVFGYYRHLITDTFVRQMYLKKTTVQIEAGEIDDRWDFDLISFLFAIEILVIRGVVWYSGLPWFDTEDNLPSCVKWIESAKNPSIFVTKFSMFIYFLLEFNTRGAIVLIWNSINGMFYNLLPM